MNDFVKLRKVSIFSISGKEHKKKFIHVLSNLNLHVQP